MTEVLTALAARIEAVPYHRSLGVRVEELVTDGVRLRIPYTDANSNPGRALHGGVYASAIDIAGVAAAWTGAGDMFGLETRTLDLTVNYLAAAIGEDIVAEAQVLRRGKETVYATVGVRNDAGKALATGLLTHRLAPPGPPDRELADVAAPETAEVLQVPPVARGLTAIPFIAGRGMRITHMHAGRSLVEMPLQPDNSDVDEVMHEGALAALLDTAGAMASWSLVGLNPSYKASTVGIHVSFHAPARGEDVAAHAHTLRRANESFQSAVTVYGRTSGRAVATGSVTYRIIVPA